MSLLGIPISKIKEVDLEFNLANPSSEIPDKALTETSDLETNCETLFFPNLLPPLKFIMEPSEC